MSDEQPRILIVDDNENTREGTARLLEYEDNIEIAGFAENGQEAVERVKELQPHVVLMDINMPDMDGIAAAALIHEQSDVPIIYVTAYTDTAVFERAIMTNPSSYLHKPFKGNELIDSIQRTLDGRKVAIGVPKYDRLQPGRGLVSAGP